MSKCGISKRTQLVVFAALTAWLGAAGSASAGNQARSGVNLGATSFFDGFGRPTAGFTSQLYLQYSMAREFHDANGQVIPAFKNPEFDTFVWLNQLSYAFPTLWFDGAVRPGLNLILPVVGFRTSFDAGGPQPQDNGVGLGDITFGPVLQFTPIISNGRPVFSQRIEFDVIGFTGKYDTQHNFNQGTNFVSLSPNWALTAVPVPGLEISARLNWIYNFRNSNPVNPPMGLMVEDARAGQQIWANVAASYEVVTSLHVGANGYFLRQLTRDRFYLKDGTETDGRAQGEGLQQVLGIGPGVFWEAAKTEKFYANVYFQLLVDARPQSNVFSLRWLHSF